MILPLADEAKYKDRIDQYFDNVLFSKAYDCLAHQSIASNMVLTYPQYVDSSKAIELYFELRENIMSSVPASEDISSKTLRQYTEQKLDRLTVALATQIDDETFLTHDYMNAVQRLYGLPNFTTYSSVFNALLFNEKLNEKRDDSHTLLDEIAARCEWDSQADVVTTLDKSAARRTNRWLRQTFPILDNIYEAISRHDGESFLPADTAHYLEEAVKSYGSWEVIYDTVTNSSHVSVSFPQSRITVPYNSRIRTATQLKALIAHEIIGHIARSTGRLAEIAPQWRDGLPMYSAFEEGFAVVLEKSIFESDTDIWPGGKLLYVAISLAYGVDGRSRTAVEVYEILRRVIKLTRHYNEDNDANRAAMSTIKRIYRGVNGTIPGTVHTRGLMYYAGFSEVASKLNTLDDQQLINWLNYVMIGKFNPLDDSHNEYVAARFGKFV